MLARLFTSLGILRWPLPWRARKTISLPPISPSSNSSEGSPKGVSILICCTLDSPSMEYNPELPITPSLGILSVSCRSSFHLRDDSFDEASESGADLFRHFGNLIMGHRCQLIRQHLIRNHRKAKYPHA